MLPLPLLRQTRSLCSRRLGLRSFASQHEARPGMDSQTLVKLQQQEQALAARNRTVPPRGSDKWFYLTAIGLLLATPPIVYFWWQHRAEHMGKKKQDMIRQIEANRKAFLEQQR